MTELLVTATVLALSTPLEGEQPPTECLLQRPPGCRLNIKALTCTQTTESIPPTNHKGEFDVTMHASVIHHSGVDKKDKRKALEKAITEKIKSSEVKCLQNGYRITFISRDDDNLEALIQCES